MNTNKELFPIKGYEGLYSITRDGNVWSHSRSKKPYIRNKQIYKGKWLTNTRNNQGYIQRILTKNGKHKIFRLHRLVAQTFIANPDNKPCINHKNMDKADNRVDNLEWCTSLENVLHSKSNGNYAMKLTKDQVYEIRGKHDPETSCKNRAWERYGVALSTYYRALNGEFSYDGV